MGRGIVVKGEEILSILAWARVGLRKFVPEEGKKVVILLDAFLLRWRLVHLVDLLLGHQMTALGHLPKDICCLMC
jgi:hypothetical protein